MLVLVPVPAGEGALVLPIGNSSLVRSPRRQWWQNMPSQGQTKPTTSSYMLTIRNSV